MTENIKVGFSNTTNTLLKVAGIVGAVTILAGGYSWYLNTLWKPKVEILFVDFNNGTAKLKYDDKEIELEGDAVYWLNADWGVKFGSIRKGNQMAYDRIELLKKGMVVEYIKK
jgi:hypothetical protein